MTFDTLVRWVDLGQPEQARAEEVLEMVEAAFAEIDHGDPRYLPLAFIEEALLEGQVPVQLLRELAQAFPPSSLPPRDDVAMVEAESRQVAQQLPPQEWRTTTFEQLEHCLATGDESILSEFVDQTSRAIHDTWRSYCANPIRPEEMTAETAVGHLLLEEGCGLWLSALSHASQLPAEEVLHEAEQGNRCLVALQKLQQKTLDKTVLRGTT